MKLKFIGEDGSMGLEHGKVYDITIFTENGYIVVRLGPHRYCPYKSPQALAANWMAIDTVNVVRCRDCIYRHTRYNCQGRSMDFFCADGERRTNHGE